MRRRLIGLLVTGIAGAGASVLLAASSDSAAQLPYPSYGGSTTPTTTTTTTTSQPSTAMQPASSQPATPHAGAAKNAVRIGDDFFRPPKLTVRRGAVVTWTWTGMNPHNVTFRSLHKHSRTQTSGSFRLRFTKKGTYHYLCTIHGFTGTIVVR